MRALIIITLQNDFCSFGNLAVDTAEKVVEKANQIIPFFDKIVAVNFSFPPNHMSFAANHLFRQPGKSMMINGRTQLLKAIHCVEGSFGAEFPANLSKSKIQYIQKVGTDNNKNIYSCFADDGAEENELFSYLQNEAISTLYFIGVVTDFFINSVNEALNRGITVKIVKEVCAGAFKNYDKLIISMDEI